MVQKSKKKQKKDQEESEEYEIKQEEDEIDSFEKIEKGLKKNKQKNKNDKKLYAWERRCKLFEMADQLGDELIIIDQDQQNKDYNENDLGYILIESDEDDDEKEKQEKMKEQENNQILQSSQNTQNYEDSFELQMRRNKFQSENKFDKFSNDIPIIMAKNKSKLKKQEYSIKQNSSIINEQTIDLNDVPYSRRENFFQTIKGLFLYWMKLFNFDFLPCQFLTKAFNQNEQEKRKFQLSYFVRWVKTGFESIGIEEKDIYEFVLQKSYNNYLIKKYIQRIMEPLLKDETIYMAFVREFKYQKGKINYFDPDIEGSVNLEFSKTTITLKMKFQTYKDRFYARVLIVSFKKLFRLVLMLEILFKVIFKESGKKVFFDVDYIFKFRWGSIRQDRTIKPENNKYYQISDCIDLVVRYQQTLNFQQQIQSLGIAERYKQEDGEVMTKRKSKKIKRLNKI